jgi:hypothetical protein
VAIGVGAPLALMAGLEKSRLRKSYRFLFG